MTSRMIETATLAAVSSDRRGLRRTLRRTNLRRCIKESLPILSEEDAGLYFQRCLCSRDYCKALKLPCPLKRLGALQGPLLAGITVGFEPVEESRYDIGVELRAGAASYFGNGILESAGTFVRAVGNHVVERISHSDDAGC